MMPFKYAKFGKYVKSNGLHYVCKYAAYIFQWEVRIDGFSEKKRLLKTARRVTSLNSITRRLIYHSCVVLLESSRILSSSTVIGNS